MYTWSEMHPNDSSETFEQDEMSDIAGDVVDSIDAQRQDEERFDEQMDEADKRLEVASYYRILLRGALFDDESEAALSVQREVRGFIKTRLEVLLGMRTEKAAVPTKQPFTEEQLEALKALANRVLKKPELVAVKDAPKPEPTLRKASATQNAAPDLKKVQTAPVLKQAQAKKQSPKSTKTASAYKAPVGVRPERVTAPLIDPSTGEKKINPNTGKPFMKDVTPQVLPPPGTPGYIPTMSKQQFEAFTASQAQVAVSKVLNPLMQQAVAEALRK